jgi:hypothetical protein
MRTNPKYVGYWNIQLRSKNSISIEKKKQQLVCFNGKQSNLEKVFGTSTCVEKPKKNGVIKIGPYLLNKTCIRALGNGGSDILYGFQRIVKKNNNCV